MKTRLLFVALFISLQFGASAQCAIDQSQLASNSGLSAQNQSGAYEGQTFKAGATGLLCEVDMLMFNNMTGTGTLNIYSGSGVGGTLLSTQIVTVNVPSMTNVWQNWTISFPPFVTNGSVYTFQFKPTQGGGIPSPYGIRLQTTNVYSGGYSLTNPGWDFTFRTYIDVSTSVHDIQSENNFVVYPNPSNGKFTVSSYDLTNYEIIVYDMLGKIIISTNNKDEFLQIDLTNHKKGIYFLTVKSPNFFTTTKIVVSE